ncbi:hypothetical protein DPMN_169287 [Dreissena polymorpha]|uniref:Uncharacterized protein n=1 Tax=Dreissena polymorpha TaxID=45954 RepID=A0A9D4IWP8_DREPO|nr:hypothetical protein DPMN_169287 [Dreissena polymorpha]
MSSIVEDASPNSFLLTVSFVYAIIPSSVTRMRFFMKPPSADVWMLILNSLLRSVVAIGLRGARHTGFVCFLMTARVSRMFAGFAESRKADASFDSCGFICTL